MLIRTLYTPNAKVYLMTPSLALQQVLKQEKASFISMSVRLSISYRWGVFYVNKKKCICMYVCMYIHMNYFYLFFLFSLLLLNCLQ